MKILVLNAGSSSHKTCLYDFGEFLPEVAPVPVWQAEVDWRGSNGDAKLSLTSQGMPATQAKLATRDRREAVREALDLLLQRESAGKTKHPDISVVGHRVVHGGQNYHEPTLVTDEVKAAISRLAVFAPLHNP